jgi:hypothetical protein
MLEVNVSIFTYYTYSINKYNLCCIITDLDQFGYVVHHYNLHFAERLKVKKATPRGYFAAVPVRKLLVVVSLPPEGRLGYKR